MGYGIMDHGCHVNYIRNISADQAGGEEVERNTEAFDPMVQRFLRWTKVSSFDSIPKFKRVSVSPGLHYLLFLPSSPDLNPMRGIS